jgi:hypothetical protein
VAFNLLQTGYFSGRLTPIIEGRFHLAKRVSVLGVFMPRSRLLARIDEELMQGRESLKFMREQMQILADSELKVAAKRQVMHREADISRLLETQEMLHEIQRETGPTTTS